MRKRAYGRTTDRRMDGRTDDCVTTVANKMSKDLGALLDSCNWDYIGNFLQICIKNSLLQTKSIEIWINSHAVPHYVCIILDHIRHINFDRSGSLKVKCDSATGLSTYGFL